MIKPRHNQTCNPVPSDALSRSLCPQSPVPCYRWGAFNLPTIAPASGKSGTAEAGTGRPNHTWFGAYAPSDQPEIAVVAFGENSGDHGGTVCRPMVLQVMEAYFQHKYPGKCQKPHG